MPNTPIVNRQIAAAPKDYTLPQSQEIILNAVHADIDGSAAGSGFLPALQLISNAGDVMWTAIDTNVTVAAGGSASVTWFPGVKTSAQATSGGSQGSMIAGTNIGTNQLFNNGSTTALSWDDIKVDSSGTFGNGGGSGTNWTINKSGMYQITLAIAPTAPWANAYGSPIRFIVDILGNFDQSDGDVFDPDGTSFNPVLIGLFSTFVSTGQVLPATMRVGLHNGSGANFNTLGGFTYLQCFRTGNEVVF